MSPTIDTNAPFDLPTGIAFRHQMALLDLAKMNQDTYAGYVTKANNAKLSIDAGRVAPTPATWPSIPFAAVIATDAFGFDYAEPGVGAPTLADIDPVKFPVIPIPADHSESSAQVVASLPQGVIDVGHADAGAGGGIFVCGPKDTWPAGVMTPPDANGHVYLKFSWAGFGYKYMQVK